MQHARFSQTCDVCGKQIKGATAEALAAHQRESYRCIPVSNPRAPPAVKEAEAALRLVMEEGQRLEGSGSLEEIERNTAARAVALQELKRVRQLQRSEKAEIKRLAQSSMSAEGWTQALLNGESARFASAETNAVETKLAAETYGLVTASEFREKRETIEAEAASKRERDAAAERDAAEDRKRAKKAKKQERERMEKRGLSFDQEDDEAG